MKPRMNTEERRYYTVEDVREGLIQEMLEGGSCNRATEGYLYSTGMCWCRHGLNKRQGKALEFLMQHGMANRPSRILKLSVQM